MFWVWKLEGDNIFSVKLLYSKLVGRGIGEELRPEEERRVFRQIWIFGAPIKVIAFALKALLDWIPIRVNLDKKELFTSGY
jgi:hypothetical protein